jgi:hypothetical protein
MSEEDGMIDVTGPDGAVHSFPHDTSNEVIKGSLDRHYKREPEWKPSNFGEAALAPITTYPETYRQQRESAINLMKSGARGLMTPSDGVAEDFVRGPLNVGKALFGALGYVASPVTAAYENIVNKPILEPAIEKPIAGATGSPLAGKLASTAVGAMIPGVGVTRFPMKTVPSVTAIPPSVPPPVVGAVSDARVALARANQEKARQFVDAQGRPMELSWGEAAQDPWAFAQEDVAKAGGLGEAAQKVAQPIQQERFDVMHGAAEQLGREFSGRADITNPEAAAAEFAAEVRAQHGRVEQQLRALQQRAGNAEDVQRQALADRERAIAERARGSGQEIGGAREAGEQVGEAIRQRAAQERADYNQRYQRAFELPGEFHAGTFEGVGQRIKNDLSFDRQEPVIIDDVTTPVASRAIRDIDANISNLHIQNRADPGGAPDPRNVVAVNLRGVDQSRKRLVAYYQAARSSNNASDVRAMGAVLHGFDDQVERAIANGLFTGDPRTLGALREARMAYRNYAQTYRPRGAGDDVGVAMRRIIERNATPEETANMLIGSGSMNSGLPVRLAQRLEQVFGRDSQEWSSIRQALWQRASQVRLANGEVDAARSVQNINRFANSTLARQTFAPEELAAMRRHAIGIRDLEQALSVMPERAAVQRAGEVYGQTFGAIGGSTGTTFQQILNGTAQPTQIANTIFNAMASGDKAGNVTRLIRSIKAISGPDSEAMGMARYGAWKLLTSKAPGADRKSFLALSNNIHNFRASSIAKELYTPEDLLRMRDFAEVVRLKAPMAGTKSQVNPAGSGVLMSMINKFGLSVLRGGAHMAAAPLGPVGHGAVEVAGQVAAPFLERFSEARRAQNIERSLRGEQPRAAGGRVSAIRALPADHQLGMRVPRGGSRCGNCRFLSSPTTCGNRGFVKWNGGATLPAPKDEYCCDLFEGKGRAAGGRAMADGGNPSDEDIASMTHYPEQPNPAQPLLDRIGSAFPPIDLTPQHLPDTAPKDYLRELYRNPEIRDRAIQQASNFNWTGTTSPRGITAYHGSPHDFERFDLSKIGTGEGAQAYGHGLYFAENEGTAKSYRDQLNYMNKEINGKRFYGNESPAHGLLSDAIDKGGNIDTAIKDAEEHLGRFTSGPDRSFAKTRMAQNAVDQLKHWKDTNAVFFNPGHMYEVAIKANPEHFLDWDKPLSEQSEHVRTAVTRAGLAPENADLGEFMGQKITSTPRWADTPQSMNALREAGIPGIKYLDQGSRGKTEGTRNYVVFDDKLIDVLKKYGMAGLIAGGAYHFQDRPQRATGGRAMADGGDPGTPDDDIRPMVMAQPDVIGNRPDVQAGVRSAIKSAAEPFGQLGRVMTGQSRDTLGDIIGAGAAMIPIGPPGAGKVLKDVGRPLARDIASRMARAEEMGFRTGMPVYHGSGDSFSSFRAVPTTAKDMETPGVSVALNPEVANEFAQGSGKASPQVYPLLHRADKPTSLMLDGSESHGEVVSTLKDAFDSGYDAVMLKNYTTPGGLRGQNIIIVRDANQLRSPNAMFDPAKKLSPNLLAGVAGMLAIPMAAFSSQHERRHMAEGGDPGDPGEVDETAAAQEAAEAAAARVRRPYEAANARESGLMRVENLPPVDLTPVHLPGTEPKDYLRELYRNPDILARNVEQASNLNFTGAIGRGPRGRLPPRRPIEKTPAEIAAEQRYSADVRARMEAHDELPPEMRAVSRGEDYAPAARTEETGLPGRGEFRGSPGVLQAQGRPDLARGEINAEPLQGLPRKVTIPGQEPIEAGPHLPARQAARDYAEQAGLPYDPPKTYQKVDVPRAERIAAEFENMKHDPENPEVVSAYNKMIQETMAQWDAIKRTGLKVEFMPPGVDYYAASPRLATEDVRNNNHLWVFSTREGFGTDPKTGAPYKPDVRTNPLLAETGEVISGRPALANDIFRIVHDYFGHIKEGVGFRSDGEENAWRSHSAMYSPEARRAMTTETRGQNSWLNHGPHGAKNRTASTADTVFADQKIGLLPDWVVNEGAQDVPMRGIDIGRGDKARRKGSRPVHEEPRASGGRTKERYDRYRQFEPSTNIEDRRGLIDPLKTLWTAYLRGLSSPFAKPYTPRVVPIDPSPTDPPSPLSRDLGIEDIGLSELSPEDRDRLRGVIAEGRAAGGRAFPAF